MPLVKIYPDSLPQSFLAQPSKYKDSLFLVTITTWMKPPCAAGYDNNL